MEYIYIGDFVNTHGLKGELKCLSDFKHKDQIFKPLSNLYVGSNKEKLVIKTYRKHKNYDMFTFDNINDIEEALIYKGEMIYILRQDLDINFLDEELIGMNVYDDKGYLGKITCLKKGIKYDFLELENGKLIPNIKEFIKNVDVNDRKIIINNIKGLIDED